VTTHTANDHIKAIFTKTSVRTRGELMATVFRDHHTPNRHPHGPVAPLPKP